MSFEQHIADGPQWIQWWVTWMMVLVFASLLFFVRWRDGSVRFGYTEAYAIFLSTIAAGVLMQWLFTQIGYVRLLGLGHIPFWTPLAIYLWYRLPRHEPRSLFGVYMRVFLATIVVSLAFDYTDVARWLMGERAPM